MEKIKLSDVVFRAKESVSKDKTDLVYYVGGEHFDNASMTVNNKGLIKGSTIGPAFSTKFRSGDVLLMSRNPHLRKAGMVNFDGICSDVSYIIRTKDENVLRQKFIPIIFQSDAFWTFAEKNKKGSTNFFLNWTDFERFEFYLPDIKRQDELCEILWSMHELKELYLKMLLKCEELIIAKYIKMFGYINETNNYPRKQWKDVVSILNGKDHKSISGSGKYGVYGTGGRMLDAKEYLCEENTIIMGRKGTIDKPFIAPEKCWVVDTAFGVNPKGNDLNYLYLFYYIKQIDYDKLNKACTLPSVTKSDLEKLWINVPPIEEQNKFASFVKTIYQLKMRISSTLEDLNNMFSTILNSEFNKEE